MKEAPGDEKAYAGGKSKGRWKKTYRKTLTLLIAVISITSTLFIYISEEKRDEAYDESNRHTTSVFDETNQAIEYYETALALDPTIDFALENLMKLQEGKKK